MPKHRDFTQMTKNPGRNWTLKIISALENYPIMSHLQGTRRIRHRLNRHGVHFKRPTNASINDAYLSLIRILKRQNPDQFVSTQTQRRVSDEIRRRTKLQFFENYLLGFRTVDIFFPSISSHSGGMKGFIYEIDGGIHNVEFKMTRDSKNYQLARSMGIGVGSVFNRDVNHPITKQILQGIGKQKRICARNRKNLIRRTQLVSLVYWNCTAQLTLLYNLELPELLTTPLEQLLYRNLQLTAKPYPGHPGASHAS